ncbi:hypothetical protein [uncultured Endozoicomonas sp.]|uniref:hypothetical protein n=1 Tax=uncultured Endozoicomonas sp. TaxID=432652 RepID=UPI00262FC3F4|nr:hypothetical protein [uncultured Endozoicomonas sp.]
MISLLNTVTPNWTLKTHTNGITTKAPVAEKQIPESGWFTFKGVFNAISGYTSITIKEGLDNNIGKQSFNRRPSHTSQDSGYMDETFSSTSTEPSTQEQPTLSKLASEMQALKFKNVDLKKRNIELQEHVEVLENLLVKEKIDNAKSKAESKSTTRTQQAKLSLAFAKNCSLLNKQSELLNTQSTLQKKLEKEVTKTKSLRKQVRCLADYKKTSDSKNFAAECLQRSTQQIVADLKQVLKKQNEATELELQDADTEIHKRDIQILELQIQVARLKNENKRLQEEKGAS